MKCKEAQILSVPHILGDLEPTLEPFRQLEAHLASCPSCAVEYEVCERTIRYLEAHRPEVASAFALPDNGKAGDDARVAIRREGQGKDVLQRVSTRWPRRIGRFAAAAACVTLGLLIWWAQGLEGRRGSARPGPDAFGGKVPPVVADESANAIRIELQDSGGRRIVAAGRAIDNMGDVKELWINDRHRLVLNVQTSLSIVPLRAESRLGCLVRLRTGEILAEVEHDGNPFVVQTAHGRATITGTIFDLRAGADESRLAVVEGTVRFESGKGAVDVIAGESSRILPDAAPTRPTICDLVAQTGWAERWVPQIRPVASNRPFSRDAGEALPLPEPFAGGRLDRTSLGYEAWTREQQNWFARQYPELFLLRDALDEDGTKVGYPGLLLDSGAVWLFVYPPASEHRLLPGRKAAIVRAAGRYGRNVEWLTGKGLLRDVSDGPAQGAFGAQALSDWQQDVAATLEREEEIPERTILASLHSCVYLLHTRSLIWLAVQSGQYHVSGVPKAELLALLRRQIDASHRGAQAAIALLGREGPDQLCQSEGCRRLIGDLHQEVGEITEVESGLAEAMGQVGP